MEFNIKRDESKPGYIYIGVPAPELKGKIDLRKCVNDEEYQTQIVNKYLNMAEEWSQIKCTDAALYGFLEGYMWISCRVEGPTDNYNLLNFK